MNLFLKNIDFSKLKVYNNVERRRINMPRISTCAARLAAALHIRGMKQVDLCSMTGIPKSAMSQYLKGTFEPKQDRIEAIARALNISEAWLMGYDNVSMERDSNQVSPSGVLSSSSAIYKTNDVRQNSFEEFIQLFAKETEGLSAEGRNKLLELAKFFKLQEEENKS